MLFLALPTIRNIQTQSMVKKAFDRTCLEEAELVHTLHYSILECPGKKLCCKGKNVSRIHSPAQADCRTVQLGAFRPGYTIALARPIQRK